MFVIELIYKSSLAEIDAQMGAHVAFLKKHYAAGTFSDLGSQGSTGRRNHSRRRQDAR